MAMNYGEGMAKEVQQAVVSVSDNGWTALQVGAAPLKGRRHLRIQIQAASGGMLALQYVNAIITNNARGISSKAFTAPTTGGSNSTRVAGGQTIMEPLSDNVAAYGRLTKKKGFTDGSVRVMVTEYA